MVVDAAQGSAGAVTRSGCAKQVEIVAASVDVFVGRHDADRVPCPISGGTGQLGEAIASEVQAVGKGGQGQVRGVVGEQVTDGRASGIDGQAHAIAVDGVVIKVQDHIGGVAAQGDAAGGVVPDHRIHDLDGTGEGRGRGTDPGAAPIDHAAVQHQLVGLGAGDVEGDRVMKAGGRDGAMDELHRTAAAERVDSDGVGGAGGVGDGQVAEDYGLGDVGAVETDRGVVPIALAGGVVVAVPDFGAQLAAYFSEI